MEMKNKKAILVWSDGIETNYTEYTSTPDKTAIEQAQDQMHKEYQEHGKANEECGAFEGDMDCKFAAEDQESYRWRSGNLGFIAEKSYTTRRILYR